MNAVAAAAGKHTMNFSTSFSSLDAFRTWYMVSLMQFYSTLVPDSHCAVFHCHYISDKQFPSVHFLSHILVCVFSSIVCSEFAGCAFHLGFMWQFELRRKKKPSNIEISMCFKQFKSSLPWHLSLRSLVRAQTKQLKPFRTHMRRLSSMFLGFG